MLTTDSITIPDTSGVGSIPDPELLTLLREPDRIERRCAVAKARVAEEIARRSSREPGHEGLAQRTGARTAEILVQQVTGDTRARARAVVAVGTVLSGDAPWLAPLGEAVESGAVSVEAPAAIRSGLGSPTAEIAGDDLMDAGKRLAGTARHGTPEQAGAAARHARAELDESGVADRERVLRDRRFLRLLPTDDGMTRLIGLLDPESAALVTDAIDQATSPRRGGPRFVDPERRARADAIVADERTTQQIAVDALVDLIRLAGAVSPSRLPERRAPEVRVHVTLADLDRRAGHATMEGQSAPVSIETVERRACETGLIPILFDDEQNVLKLGRSARCFTPRQRIALAAQSMRDGTRGCAVESCDRPPSWCEAHHIRHWRRDRGETDVENGVLLCRHHHLLAHDHHWEIRREPGGRPVITIPAVRGVGAA